jgi:hypothetical protein
MPHLVWTHAQLDTGQMMVSVHHVTDLVQLASVVLTPVVIPAQKEPT